MGTRGLGHTYKRGKIWHIKWYVNGEELYESSKSQFRRDAVALLKTKLASPTPAKKTGSVLIGELLDDYLVYFKKAHPKSYQTFALPQVNKLRPFWGERKASAISTGIINEFIELRLKEVGANATVNRGLAVLSKAFNLAKEATPPKVGEVPKFRMLRESNPRDGFMEPEQYHALLEALPEELKISFVIGYHTGARKEEILSIRLDQVHREDGKIQLRPGTTKNDEGRWLPIYGEMIEAIARQVEATRRDFPNCLWLSHRGGDRIGKDIRYAWEKACASVGMPDLLFHDLRRSAIRNMVRANIPEKVIMKITGHKTRSVFDRYNIVDNRDIENAGKTMTAWFKGRA
jgi:integrase